MKRLTDEKARAWIRENFEDLVRQSEPAGVYPTDWHRQAQLEQDLEKMIEWVEGDCPHRIMADPDGGEDIPLRKRGTCPSCLQSLKEELEELQQK